MALFHLLTHNAGQGVDAGFINIRYLKLAGVHFVTSSHAADDGCASGLRYVLYMYMTSLEDPTKVIAQPGGYFLVPEGEEYIGDVMNVVFTNGWIADEDGKVFIYYASSDTRMHVATSTIDRLVDYCMNTPKDDYRTQFSVEKIKALVAKNKETLNK